MTNNLVRRKDELVQALQEISVEDRHQQLENAINDLKVKDVTKKVATHISGFKLLYFFIFYPILKNLSK